MRVLVVALSLLFPFPSFVPQQTVTRDNQAVSLLQASISAMGNVPSDSTASGSVVVTAGASTSSGTVQILTRGTTQTSEQLALSDSTQTTIFSNGAANLVQDGTGQSLCLERTASSQSVMFPLPFLAAALANPDISLQFVGSETQGQHVRLWNTYSSNSFLQFLSDFTTTDIWLDSTTGLPNTISFTRRDSGGASSGTTITISYSNFQNASGVAYPYSIQESINGTSWATITIQNVAFNTGLTDANFPVTQGGN